MTTEPTAPDTAQPETASLGTHFVTRLLDRHQVPQRQRAAQLSEALGLSYQQVRRRLVNVSEWTILELQTVAEHYGETLQSLVADGAAPPSSPPPHPSATLVVGPLRLPCQAWVGQPTQTGREGPLVALRQAAEDGKPEKWVVVTSDQAQGAESFEVVRIVLEPSKPARLRIAVLDDDRDLAQSIAEYLVESGFDATAFFSLERFSAAVRTAGFDGYIVDWLINKHPSKDVLAEIRTADPSCPIIVLTGQMAQGRVAESELATVAKLHTLQYFEKPVRTSVLKSALEFGFGRAATT
ncbi:helix-turn-helix domain-containing protein [Ottowia sp.]|uniref:helix-turn-helix domain-containing protein n=1 Tax=Ottowia sp. TaxID=1898956 RepID=UPI0025CD4FD6|nr:helix-turn-helix domain-containing protein [Ottowia sp.]MBK6616069.1 response regulator [Ottowia sp.]